MIVFKATSSVVEMRDGAFSTNYRYIRERATGTFGMIAGQTCGALVLAAGHDGDSAVRNSIYWRYVCGSYVAEKTRQTSWINNVGSTISQSLTVPTVTGSVTEVDAP